MKILHIIIGLNVGGAELMLKRLIESFQEYAEYEHSVISLTSVGEVGERLQAIGVEVNSLGLRSIIDLPRVILQLVRLLRSSSADIVQTWMYHADLLGGLCARIVGKKSVIWGIRTTDVDVGSGPVTRMVMRLCAQLSSKIPRVIVCAAEASRRKHISYGYDASRMVVVPNGFDFTVLKASPAEQTILRERCGILPHELVIGTLGRFNPAKDHENFVRAAGVLLQKHENLKILMIGRDLDGSNDALARWITRTGHANRFTLLGERADVPVCLSIMDIFCLSSRSEGFPNVVGEAMGMGVPCVVTDVGDAAMLLGDTGIVVPKEDPVALAHALEQLVATGEGARQQLGIRAKTRVHDEFSMLRTRTRFEDIYKRLA